MKDRRGGLLIFVGNGCFMWPNPEGRPDYRWLD